MSELSTIVDRINTISGTLFFLEGHIVRLQEARDVTSLKLEQLRSAQRFACEEGHKWPGPPREALEAALVAHRDAELDFEEALRGQARYMGALREAQGELQKAKLEAKRAQRNRPLTGRPFAALLG